MSIQAEPLEMPRHYTMFCYAKILARDGNGADYHQRRPEMSYSSQYPARTPAKQRRGANQSTPDESPPSFLFTLGARRVISRLLRRSISLIAVQPRIPPIHRNCLYSLANFMLNFPMFSSLNPLTSPRSPAAPSLSRTSSVSYLSFTSCSQSLPTFSTASKHPARRNVDNSIPLMPLLHNSLDTRGGPQPAPRHLHVLASSPVACAPLLG